MRPYKSFLSDEDGLSARDFLMMLFIGIFLLEQSTMFVWSLFNNVSNDTIRIMQTLDVVIMTIIGGVFSVQAVKEFRRTEESSEEIYDSEPHPPK